MPHFTLFSGGMPTKENISSHSSIQALGESPVKEGNST
jgi:hypothetical protein